MTNSINLTSAITPVTPDTSSASSATSSASTTLTSSSNASVAATDDSNTISPRISYNSTVGLVVTEFLNGSGQVEVQLPSKVAIAYLEAGLTAQGGSKPQAAPGSDSYLNQASA